MKTRNTIQQAIVEQQLHALGNHPTAEQVYLSIHETHPAISKTTVYRALNRLVEQHRALKVPVPSGADHFDHRTDDHYHVVCTQCGNVKDVEFQQLEDHEEDAARQTGYAISGHVLVFEGVCPRCQAEREKA